MISNKYCSGSHSFIAYLRLASKTDDLILESQKIIDSYSLGLSSDAAFLYGRSNVAIARYNTCDIWRSKHLHARVISLRPPTVPFQSHKIWRQKVEHHVQEIRGMINRKRKEMEEEEIWDEGTPKLSIFIAAVLSVPG